MKRLKVICLLLVAVLMLGLFVGCGSSDNDSTSSKSSDYGIFSTADITFVANGNESVYEIVRPEKGTSSVSGYLFKQMKEKFGVSPKNTTDSGEGADKYEILVGSTNRPESSTAKQYLIDNVSGRDADYIIATIGKKIVLFGMSDEATQKAVEYFAANYLKPEGIKGGIKYTYAAEGNFAEAKINGKAISGFKLVRARYNESYVTQYSINEALAAFKEQGDYTVEFVEDHLTATDYEIIVGDCNRDGVEKFTDKDAYSIKISGKKVYLNGGSPSARALAVSEFTKMVLSKKVTDADSVTGSYSATVASYDKSKTYTVKWNDDFDTASDTHPTGVDLNKWTFRSDHSSGYNGRKSYRSQDPAHLIVQDGKLNFRATYDDKYYYSFKIDTRDHMTFTYGIFEMSAILPHGDGFWTALWAGTPQKDNPTAFNPEINVVECFGNSATFASNMHGWKNSYQATLYDEIWAPLGVKDHWSLDQDSNYRNQKKYACPEGKFNDGFHTFSYVWTPDMCGFACDGNLFCTLNPNDKQEWKDTFSLPLGIILSQATCFASGAGKSMPDDAPEWQESNNFIIDYVHVYQKDDGVHQFAYLK